MSPGDSLFLYTDGVTEAFDANQVQFGDRRLAERLTNCGNIGPRDMLEQVTETVGCFAGETDQSDDITCLILRFTGPVADNDARVGKGMAPASEQLGDPSVNARPQPEQELSVVLKNEQKEVHRLAELIESFGAAHGWPMKLILDLNLALDEIIRNTINYGYEHDGKHEITVNLGIRDGLVIVDVEDDAKPFDPLSAPKPDINAPVETRAVGGLGVHIVKSLMERVSYRYEDGRNRLRMEKSI